MGIRFCSCSQAYCKDHVQCFDDLPNSAGAHSTRTCTQFQAHKIVSTMKLYPKKKLKRRHSMNAKTITIVPRKRKNSEPIPDILPALISDFSSSGSSDYKQRSPIDSTMRLKSARTNRGDLKTYTLYREGVVTRKSNQNQLSQGGNESNELEDVPSTRSVHSITSVMMLEMDIEGESAILTERLKLNHILSRVPPRYLWMRWKAVYSLLADGCSMQTLFDKVSNVEQSVMIIQDQWDNVLLLKSLHSVYSPLYHHNSMNEVFGAFLDCRIDEQSHHYGGTNDCFVFRFESSPKEYSIFEYHNTEHYDQPYYLRCTVDHDLLIGAGECPAIYLEHDLLCGSTKRCSTFHSDPLSPQNMFKIKNLEIWCPALE